MTDSISYRGPDGEGFYIEENIALGHRRLSIIDLSTGSQPMFNEDASIVLVFNGEIYNYIELRDELTKLNHTFHSTSDTEVIIRAYEEWGTGCQARFNGMWAFALWDKKKQKLFLSRDRIGEKPLYYAIFDNSIIFASEIKAILTYGVPGIPDTELLEIYLSLSFIPAPYTFFKDIRKLKAGNYLLAEEVSKIIEEQYWDVPQIDENRLLKNKEDVYANFVALFKDSVRLRMRSDVPYGAFLSGGLDSSSVVSCMSEISSFPVETFTIGFNSTSYDERGLAKQVADKFDTNHHEFLVEPSVFEESLSRIVHHYDEPFGDSSAIPTGFVSKFASSRVKMVLTGDGGDEVLAGYTNYRREKFASKYNHYPGWVKSGMPVPVMTLSKLLGTATPGKLIQLDKLFQESKKDFQARYMHNSLAFHRGLIKQLTKGNKVYPIEDFLSDFMKNCPYKDSFYQLTYLNLKLTLPDDMLVKVDRMSMAYSLETRTPFLDHRIIEYMMHVDKTIKMNGFERKSVLVNTIAKQLPPALLKAPKKGFAVPLHDWFNDDAFDESLSSLVRNSHYLNKEGLKEIIKINKAGEKKSGNFIWMLFVLNKILKDH